MDGQKRVYKMKYNESELFPQGESLGERVWGEEISIYNCPSRYTFKILKINAGCKGGLQFHRMKDEVTYIVSGTLIIRYDLEDGEGLKEKVLKAGQWVRFPTGMVHQEEAVTDVIRIEASSPFLNDRVRVEEEYGQEFSGGLPTTSIEDIIEI